MRLRRSPRLALAVPAVTALAVVATTGPPAAVAARQPDAAAAAVAPTVASGAADTAAQLPATAALADRRIYDLVRHGDRVYALGEFTTIGTYGGPGRALEAGTGADVSSPQIADGQVSVVVGDGAGGWYLAGDFSRIGDEQAGGLAHVLADGTLDTGFLPVANGLVDAVALDGDTLYLGGDFTEVDGTTRHRLAAVSTADGALLPFDAPHPHRVTELVVAPASGDGGARLFVGSDALEALDPVTGAAAAGFTSPVDTPVRAMTLSGDRLYVGGHDLVALDVATGALDAGFDPGDPAPGDQGWVHTLLDTGDVLYAGGDRAMLAGQPGRLVALDPATGAALPGFAPEVSGGQGTFGDPGGVYDLALDGDRLWLAGSFTSVGGSPAGRLAVVDATTGARDGIDLPSYDLQVNAVDVAGGTAYVGGHFFLTDWVRSRGLAALDAATLAPVPGFRGRLGPWGGELVVSDNAVYVTATHFLGYDSSDVRAGDYFYGYTWRVRAYDPDTGAPLPALSRRVRNLTGVTTLGSDLIVARRLQDDVRFPRNAIDVYDADGTRVASYLFPLRGYITSLTTIDGDLVAAGSFKRRTPRGYPRNTALVRVDVRTGDRRPWFDPRIDGPVYDVVTQGHSLFASGIFTRVNQLADVRTPGVVKLTARSHEIGDFSPTAVPPTGAMRRLNPLGDLMWVDGDHSLFLDTTFGRAEPDPTGGYGPALGSIVAAAGGYDFSSMLTIRLGGEDYKYAGYVGRVVD